MAKFSVILPAAGSSSRFGQKQKKVFVDLAGRPVWLRTVEHFSNRPDVIQLILVLAEDDIEWFKEKFRPNLAFLDLEIVAGGAQRADSVERGLARVSPEADFVAVHDAARPLLAEKWIDRVFAAAIANDAAILATPITSTIKRAAGQQQVIAETVPRDHLWAAQTPQVFRTSILRAAYQSRRGFSGTDEAQLVERIGGKVQLVECSAANLKITSPEDLSIAAALLPTLPKKSSLRSLHPFSDEDPLGL